MQRQLSLSVRNFAPGTATASSQPTSPRYWPDASMLRTHLPAHCSLRGLCSDLEAIPNFVRGMNKLDHGHAARARPYIRDGEHGSLFPQGVQPSALVSTFLPHEQSAHMHRLGDGLLKVFNSRTLHTNAATPTTTGAATIQNDVVRRFDWIQHLGGPPRRQPTI